MKWLIFIGGETRGGLSLDRIIAHTPREYLFIGLLITPHPNNNISFEYHLQIGNCLSTQSFSHLVWATGELRVS